MLETTSTTACHGMEDCNIITDVLNIARDCRVAFLRSRLVSSEASDRSALEPCGAEPSEAELSSASTKFHALSNVALDELLEVVVVVTAAPLSAPRPWAAAA